MKPLLFVYIFVSCCLVVKSQDLSDVASMNYKTFSIPAAQTYSTSSIAGYVQSNFKSAPEKLQAIYTWVITNIRYDADSMYPINWSMEREEKIAATLRRKKGVCENYAALFTDIALKSGFQSFVISGYTKMQGPVNRAGHSWCAVRLQQQWLLCDPTWDAGSGGSASFFLIKPARFIESHIPFDPLWQLLEYPITAHEFDRGIFHPKKENAAFVAVADSVNAFLRLDSLQQMEASARRIRQAGVENERQKDWLAYNQMKIAVIYGENDMDLYNSAVADLNKANAVFNNFVGYRNNRFIPARLDAEIKSLLDPIQGLLSSALHKLNQMGQAVENFQYDTATIKDRLQTLAARVEEQKKFLKRYLGSAPGERGQLFYK